MADLALAMLRNGYLTSKVVMLDGGIHPEVTELRFTFRVRPRFRHRRSMLYWAILRR